MTHKRLSATSPTILASRPPLPAARPLGRARPSQAHQLACHVREFMARLLTETGRPTNRHDDRVAYPCLVRVTPVRADGAVGSDEQIVVVGKNISAGGLGFYHPQPLPYRRAIVDLTDASGQQVSLLTDLRWCRFTSQGWYVSGGRFLQVVSTPAA